MTKAERKRTFKKAFTLKTVIEKIIEKLEDGDENV